MDMGFAKAWAEWGEYHDRMYKEQPHDLTIAANAVSCYLQAAGLYKSAKVRKLLVRILWLLSLDDAAGTVSKAFDSYKGEVPTWYWITFIPQLLMALSQREARYARIILMKIAKTFPQVRPSFLSVSFLPDQLAEPLPSSQSLFFQLRTMREDLAMAKRQHAQNTARLTAARAAEAAAAGQDGETSANGEQQPGGAPPGFPPGSHPGAASGHRHPWEHVDEIMSILKTAFPLLALSMEMIVDQVATRFKPGPDEDIYRLVSALLSDALQVRPLLPFRSLFVTNHSTFRQQYVIRAQHPTDDGLLSETTTSNVARFAENLHPVGIKVRRV